MPINLEKYFERIGYTGSTDVSISTLTAIHAAQLSSIPFEGLAIHEPDNINNPNAFIGLDENTLFKKLVTDKRGGYCHENNELLALVLTQLGFTVNRLAARVLTAPAELPLGHKLLLVSIADQHWIADVGFGGYGLFEPLSLIADQETRQNGDNFRLTLADQKYTLQIFVNNAWKNLYEFKKEFFKAVDFEPMSYYSSHHPDSIFVKNKICVISKPEGRITLVNESLKIMRNGKEEVITVSDAAMHTAVLKKYFGIELSKKTEATHTESWLRFFSKAATIGVGAASTVYLAKRFA